MILSLFSLFLFFVFARGEVVEQVSPIGSPPVLEQEETNTKRTTQSEEDCRYQDEPIPRRDLSNYVVESELPSKSISENDVERELNDVIADTDENDKLQVELEPKQSNDEAQE